MISRETYNPAEIDEETEELRKRARNITEREKLFVEKFQRRVRQVEDASFVKIVGAGRRKRKEKVRIVRKFRRTKRFRGSSPSIEIGSRDEK